MIKLILSGAQGTIDITDLVQSVKWSGDKLQAARMLDFDVLTSPYDTGIPKINIAPGDGIYFYHNNVELFRGYIFLESKSYSGTAKTYTAYDIAIYTLKNEGAYNFRNITPEEATKRICNEFGIPIGGIASTNISISKKFIVVKLYDIIMSAYTIASQNNGNKYMVVAKEGKLNVIIKGEQSLEISFENGRNLLDTSYSKSIENMVNNILIVNKDGEKIRDVSDQALINTYGRFQKVITQQDDKDESKKAQKMIQGIEDKISITGIGDVKCTTGAGVKVFDSYTGIQGYFYIDSDTHTWSNGQYSVVLNLNLENLMNETERGSDFNE